MTMDERTLQIYAVNAQEFCERYRSTLPQSLYQLIQGFFHPGGITADIGCGSGRDVEWLRAREYPTVGYDASAEMIAAARSYTTDIDLRQSSLPNLAEIPDEAFSNILCSATLMHIRREDLITAVLNLARILTSGGRLVLSYRYSQNFQQEREVDGRLFTTIPIGRLMLLLESAGFQILLSTETSDQQRPYIFWHTLAIEKSPLQVARGLERIQSVLAQDRKVATYKLALIRALCAISRTQSHLVHWYNNIVYVPLRAIALQWLIYYWPLLTAPSFIAQIRGEKPTSKQPIAFRSTLQQLASEYSSTGLFDLLKQIDENPRHFDVHLKIIGNAIKQGPVTFAGTSGPKLFSYVHKLSTHPEIAGWVIVPQPVWLDICRFEHWIEDSVIVRWARLTAEMNPDEPLGLGRFLVLLLSPPRDERTTREVRMLLEPQKRSRECIWSAQSLMGGFEVDHLVPYSVWGNNDLWNLLPCIPKFNRNKSDALPTQRLLIRRRDCLFDYWQFYQERWPERFNRQIARALGGEVKDDWKYQAFTGLQEHIQRLATTRGLSRWEP
jgi:SAM-dependent methyltransferase